jgi:hypothetical protein
MNEHLGIARRYHWLGERVEDFVCEPHTAIQNLSLDARQDNGQLTLNMVAKEAAENRAASASLIREHPQDILEVIRAQSDEPTLFAPAHHAVLPCDANLKRLEKIVRFAHETYPADFETLLGTANVGPATIRSLALIAELLYGARVSHRDPALPQTCCAATTAAHSQRKWADSSYAHGGKDGHPFPVDRTTYDQSISVLTDVVRRARIGETEKRDALKRLAKITP